jgi:hypothetical protein
VVLVAAGGHATVHLLEHLADLLVILTRCTLEAADPAATLATAAALRCHLAADGIEPLIVLLTQALVGTEEDGPASAHLPEVLGKLIE